MAANCPNQEPDLSEACLTKSWLETYVYGVLDGIVDATNVHVVAEGNLPLEYIERPWDMDPPVNCFTLTEVNRIEGFIDELLFTGRVPKYMYEEGNVPNRFPDPVIPADVVTWANCGGYWLDLDEVRACMTVDPEEILSEATCLTLGVADTFHKILKCLSDGKCFPGCLCPECASGPQEDCYLLRRCEDILNDCGEAGHECNAPDVMYVTLSGLTGPLAAANGTHDVYAMAGPLGPGVSDCVWVKSEPGSYLVELSWELTRWKIVVTDYDGAVLVPGCRVVFLMADRTVESPNDECDPRLDVINGKGFSLSECINDDCPAMTCVGAEASVAWVSPTMEVQFYDIELKTPGIGDKYFNKRVVKVSGVCYVILGRIDCYNPATTAIQDDYDSCTECDYTPPPPDKCYTLTECSPGIDSLNVQAPMAADYLAGKIVKYNGKCYEITAEFECFGAYTVLKRSDYSVHDSCPDCLKGCWRLNECYAVNEIWKSCNDDSITAVTAPDPSGPRVGWVCSGGQLIPSYKSVDRTETEPGDHVILYQCDVPAETCDDLIGGYYASDTFDGCFKIDEGSCRDLDYTRGCGSAVADNADLRWFMRWHTDQEEILKGRRLLTGTTNTQLGSRMSVALSTAGSGSSGCCGQEFLRYEGSPLWSFFTYVYQFLGHWEECQLHKILPPTEEEPYDFIFEATMVVRQDNVPSSNFQYSLGAGPIPHPPGLEPPPGPPPGESHGLFITMCTDTAPKNRGAYKAGYRWRNGTGYEFYADFPDPDVTPTVGNPDPRKVVTVPVLLPQSGSGTPYRDYVSMRIQRVGGSIYFLVREHASPSIVGFPTGIPLPWVTMGEASAASIGRLGFGMECNYAYINTAISDFHYTRGGEEIPIDLSTISCDGDAAPQSVEPAPSFIDVDNNMQANYLADEVIEYNGICYTIGGPLPCPESPTTMEEFTVECCCDACIYPHVRGIECTQVYNYRTSENHQRCLKAVEYRTAENEQVDFKSVEYRTSEHLQMNLSSYEYVPCTMPGPLPGDPEAWVYEEIENYYNPFDPVSWEYEEVEAYRNPFDPVSWQYEEVDCYKYDFTQLDEEPQPPE